MNQLEPVSEQPLTRSIKQRAKRLPKARIDRAIRWIPGNTGIPLTMEADHHMPVAQEGCREGAV